MAKENVSTAKEKGIRRETAQSTLSPSRLRERMEKVRLSLIYSLPNVLRAHVMHGYWIPVLVLTFVHPYRI